MLQWPAEHGMHTCMQAAQPKQLEMRAMPTGQNPLKSAVDYTKS